MSSSPSFFNYFIPFVLGVLVLACGQSLYIPSIETASDANMIDELTMGRKLYIKQCGSCHNLYTPQTYSGEKWKEEMNEMQHKAKISDHEAELILKYLTGFK